MEVVVVVAVVVAVIAMRGTARGHLNVTTRTSLAETARPPPAATETARDMAKGTVAAAVVVMVGVALALALAPPTLEIESGLAE